jgi:hypothetical protein
VSRRDAPHAVALASRQRHPGSIDPRRTGLKPRRRSFRSSRAPLAATLLGSFGRSQRDCQIRAAESVG